MIRVMNDPFDRSFRDRTLAGETLLGLFLDLGSPASAELCAAVG
jgi:2-keto-3-deoxy-L-rhamnonate aldolase RhmA